VSLRRANQVFTHPPRATPYNIDKGKSPKIHMLHVGGKNSGPLFHSRPRVWGTLVLIILSGCFGVVHVHDGKLENAALEIKTDSFFLTDGPLPVEVTINVDRPNPESIVGIEWSMEAIAGAGLGSQVTAQTWNFLETGIPKSTVEITGADDPIGTPDNPTFAYSYDFSLLNLTLQDATRYRILMRAMDDHGRKNDAVGSTEFTTDFSGPDVDIDIVIGGDGNPTIDFESDDPNGVVGTGTKVCYSNLDGNGGFSPCIPITLPPGSSGSITDPTGNTLAPDEFRQYIIEVIDSNGHKTISKVSIPAPAINSTTVPASIQTGAVVTFTVNGKAFGKDPKLLIRENGSLVLAPIDCGYSIVGAEQVLTCTFTIPNDYFLARIQEGCATVATCTSDLLSTVVDLAVLRSEDGQEIVLADDVPLNLNPAYDSDGDGVGDVAEIDEHHTNPTLATQEASVSLSTLTVSCPQGSATAGAAYRSQTCTVTFTPRNGAGSVITPSPAGTVRFALQNSSAIGSFGLPPAGTYSTTFTANSSVSAITTDTITATWTGTATNQISSVLPTITVRPRPTCSFSGPPAGWRTTSLESINYSCSNMLDVTDVECSLDGAAFASCDSSTSHQLSSLTNGNHNFRIRAVDIVASAGAEATISWMTDLNNPTATLTAQPTNPSSDTTPSFSFTAFDVGPSGLDHVECRVGAAAYAPCTSPVNLTLGEGSYTFDLRPVDVAGRVGAVQSVSWTIDTTGPVCTITSAVPAEASWRNNATETLTYSCTDPSLIPNANYECDIDGTPVPCDSVGSESVSGLSSNSTHTFRVRATDSVSNVGGYATRSWNTDLDQPTTPVISSSPTNPTTSTSASFVFSSTDSGGSPGLNYLCAIDGGAYQACTSPQTYNSLAEGSHSFLVTVIDTAGNVAPGAGARNWDIDVSAPTCTITSVAPAQGSWRNAGHPATENLAFTCSDSYRVGSIMCSVDGGAYAACTSVSGLLTTSASGNQNVGSANGAHSLAVLAFDWVAKSATASRSWNTDRNGPTAGFSAPNMKTSQSFTVTLSGGDTGGSGFSHFMCSLDNGTPSFAPCSSGQTWNAGSNTSGIFWAFRTYSVDVAGNTSAWTADSWTNRDASWTGWSACSYTCGPGGQKSRSCSGQSGAGAGCSGNSVEGCDNEPQVPSGMAWDSDGLCVDTGRFGGNGFTANWNDANTHCNNQGKVLCALPDLQATCNEGWTPVSGFGAEWSRTIDGGTGSAHIYGNGGCFSPGLSSTNVGAGFRCCKAHGP
jgi:hypothetical protein